MDRIVHAKLGGSGMKIVISDMPIWLGSSLRQTTMRDEESHQPIPAKKDKKRWCGGHVGREHKPACKSFKEIKKWGNDNYRILVCENCGKEMAIYYGFDKSIKPEWVTF